MVLYLLQPCFADRVQLLGGQTAAAVQVEVFLGQTLIEDEHVVGIERDRNVIIHQLTDRMTGIVVRPL